MKKPKLDFDNHIADLDELIKQLESLKAEAMEWMPQDEIFAKDYHALRIVVRYLKEIKNG